MAVKVGSQRESGPVIESRRLRTRSSVQSQNSWSPAPAALSLDPNEAHLWRINLASKNELTSNAMNILSAEEQARAARFRFRQDGRRYVNAHAALRRILGRYVLHAPESIKFRNSSLGKPELAERGEIDLFFNLSHSHELALVAITRARAVGVDVEFVRGDITILNIAERFFCKREVEMLQTLDGERQVEGFFMCWTQKEAYLKARGEGLSHPINAFEVNCIPGARSYLRVNGDSGKSSGWTLLTLSVGIGYQAALALQGNIVCIRYWQ